MYCPNDQCPDFESTGLRAEYRQDLTACPFCGTTLVAAPPESPSPTFDDHAPKPQVADDEAMEPIMEATDPTEVAVIKSILDGAGIPYLAHGEDGFNAFRGAFVSGSIFNPRGRGVIFVVPARMADDARALLEELVDETLDSGANR